MWILELSLEESWPRACEKMQIEPELMHERDSHYKSKLRMHMQAMIDIYNIT